MQDGSALFKECDIKRKLAKCVGSSDLVSVHTFGTFALEVFWMRLALRGPATVHSPIRIRGVACVDRDTLSIREREATGPPLGAVAHIPAFVAFAYGL